MRICLELADDGLGFGRLAIADARIPAKRLQAACRNVDPREEPQRSARVGCGERPVGGRSFPEPDDGARGRGSVTLANDLIDGAGGRRDEDTTLVVALKTKLLGRVESSFLSGVKTSAYIRDFGLGYTQ